MGKCVSKHPSTLTIATLTEQELAAAKQILRQLSHSREHLPHKERQQNCSDGNQLAAHGVNAAQVSPTRASSASEYDDCAGGDDSSSGGSGHLQVSGVQQAAQQQQRIVQGFMLRLQSSGVKEPNNNNNTCNNKQHCYEAQESVAFASVNCENIQAERKEWAIAPQTAKGCAAVENAPEDAEYIHRIETDLQGQAESKRRGRKECGLETKGTAMSFGFRKKLNTTPKKLKKFIEGDSKKQKQGKCSNGKVSSHEAEQDAIGANGRASIYSPDEEEQEPNERDDNGNAAEPLPRIYFEKMGAAAKTGQRFESMEGNVMQRNRFGYRSTGVVRPLSAGVTGQVTRQQQDMTDNLANNNCGNVGETSCTKPTAAGAGLVSNLKRRSKSAHAGSAPGSESDAANGAPKISQPKTITFNLKQNSTIEYQRQQFFQQPPSAVSVRGGTTAPGQHRHANIIHSGLHTNVIVRPTPRIPAVTYSKFTLHTVSLPKPEFPVAISLSASTPTTPGSIYSPTPMANTVATTYSLSGIRLRDAHPLTAVASQSIDLKSAKQMANNTRRGFTGSREISADSGIASMDMALDSSHSSASSAAGAIAAAVVAGAGGGRRNARHDSPKRSRSRPRNLQMVMNGRHKFEVRDLVEPVSSTSESSSLVVPLALPKLPAENQTMPLPLSGLVRSNTVLSRESFERDFRCASVKPGEIADIVPQYAWQDPENDARDESGSVEEVKLSLDRSASEKRCQQNVQQISDATTCLSNISTPGNSMMSSWGNAAGESLASKVSGGTTATSNELGVKSSGRQMSDVELKIAELTLELDDDISLINTDQQISTISSITDSGLALERAQLLPLDGVDNGNMLAERPKTLYNSVLNESKFAEMAMEGSAYLLDDETSPTDSLVSSSESDEMVDKQKKHKLNKELHEKDIDEISPELEVSSPISPGTPTHASHSLSLSDCGNLIDDEIADQPALLFNNDNHGGIDGGMESSVASRREKTDTPTLMETANTSLHSLKSQSKARTALQQAIELSLRTPLALRKAVMERAESLDTLSPCESICSDDLMMDFDINSSMDSIDHSTSQKSRSGSDLQKIDVDDTELFSELERKGSDVMQELSTILRVHKNRRTEKESVIAHLPARATRLLNRSRIQQHQQQHPAAAQCPSMFGSATAADSDSSRSTHSLRRGQAASRASSASAGHSHDHPASQRHQRLGSRQQQLAHLQQHRDSHSSSDDLMLYDKSFRNAMIQDVLQFKKQLLRLRRILQEDEDCLRRTETLNPFENDNGQLFANCGLDSKLLDDIDLASLTSSTTDDPIQELTDIRRQVVYLQSQVDDRDRTIRLQRTLIEKLEAEKKAMTSTGELPRECISSATQTERARPASMAAEGLSRSKPEYTSYTTHFPLNCADSTTIVQHQPQYTMQQQQQQQQQSQPQPQSGNNQTRRHTIISTTLSNYNQQFPSGGNSNGRGISMGGMAPRRASIAWESPKQHMPTYKPVRITLIGEPLKPFNGDHVPPHSNKFMNGSGDSGTPIDIAINGGGGGGGGSDGGGKTDLMASGSCNGLGKSNRSKMYEEAKMLESGLQHVYQQLENNKQQQQHQLRPHRRQETKGNLYPTVTIV